MISILHWRPLQSLLLLVFAALASFPSQAQQRIALVVGNYSYESAPLTSPRYDASAMEKSLADLGFTVKPRVNLDQNSFREELRDFSTRLKKNPGAIALFYYSGHGMQVNGVNYLVPTGARIDSEADVSIYGVRVDEVILRMTTGGASTSILVLDACRNNPYEKRFKSADAGLARTPAPPGVVIAYAAAPGTVAIQATGGALSPYTAALVSSLAQPTPLLLTLQRVANRVHSSSKGNQSPYIETSAGFDAAVTLVSPKAVEPTPTLTKRTDDQKNASLIEQQPRPQSLEETIALIRASQDPTEKRELKASARKIVAPELNFGTIEGVDDNIYRSFSFVSYDPDKNILIVDQKYEARGPRQCSPVCSVYEGRLTIDLSRVDRVQTYGSGEFDLDCWYSAQYQNNKCITYKTQKNTCQYAGCDSGSDQSIPFHLKNNAKAKKLRLALQAVIYKIDGRPAF